MCRRNLLWDTAPAVCQKVSEKDAFTANVLTILLPLKIFRIFCFGEKLPSATDLSNTQHFNPMDKNTVTGLVLIVLVLIGFSWYNSAQQAEYQQMVQNDTTIVQTQAPKTQPSAVAAAPAATNDSLDVFREAKQGKAKDIVLKNNKITVTLNTRGGTLKEVKLNEYKSYADFEAERNVSLCLYNEKDASSNILLDTKEGVMAFNDYVFTPTAVTDSTATLTLQGAGGETITLDYKLLPDNYLLDFTVSSANLRRILPSSTRSLQMKWNDKVARHEKGFYFENMYSTLTYRLQNGETEKMSEAETEEVTAEDAVNWIAFKNQYFSSILIAEKPLKEVNLRSEQLPENGDHLKNYSAHMKADFDAEGKQPTRFQYYFGPNNYRLLQSMDEHSITGQDYDLQELVYLGWPIVRWINRYFTLYVFDFFTRMGLPMGIVLLLITILLRVIVYVPTRKSFMSSAKMRVLKPKVDEISAKYPKKEDAMKKQQEIMSLYSQYGVSPMGGCLPMLIQMPIWIAMFNFVPNAIEMRQQGFLWADDLSTYDSLISWSTPIWGLGNHISLFCLLFCATNLLYSFMTMRQQRESMSGEQAQQMKVMQWMMMLMPLFFFFMFNKYSAGLNYYYFISLLFSALTMWFLRKTTDDKKLLAKLEANFIANKNNPNKKPGGLAARLEALQKQQEEIMKRQQQARNRS